MVKRNLVIFHLNTSHVNVNLLVIIKLEYWNTYLNTSHVNVNPLMQLQFVMILQNLNTSHVNVNRVSLF